MKVLMVTHPYNFGPHLKGSVGTLSTLMEQYITSAGMTYEYCTFIKDDILKAIKNGCTYIIIFAYESIKTASEFLGESSPDDGVIARMYSELYNIEKLVPIYPPVSVMELHYSKMYMVNLPNKTKIFMPHTKYFMYYKTTLNSNIKNACVYFKRMGVSKIVIKLGYSGDTNNVYIYTVEDLHADLSKTNLLTDLEYHRTMVGKPFLVIVQPFNPVVANRLNEYRMLVIGGLPVSIAAFGFRLSPENTRIYIPSVELDPENISEHARILELAQTGYNILSKYIGPMVVIRVDITWEILADGRKHYYINELENLCGTFYFGIKYQPKEAARAHRITDKYQCVKEICSVYPRWIQTRMAKKFVLYLNQQEDIK